MIPFNLGYFRTTPSSTRVDFDAFAAEFSGKRDWRSSVLKEGDKWDKIIPGKEGQEEVRSWIQGSTGDVGGGDNI